MDRMNELENGHLLIKIATHVASTLLTIVRENYFDLEWRFLFTTLACARGLLLHWHIAELILLWHSRCNTYTPSRTDIDTVSVNFSILILGSLIWASAYAILVFFASCNLDKNMLVFEKNLTGIPCFFCSRRILSFSYRSIIFMICSFLRSSLLSGAPFEILCPFKSWVEWDWLRRTLLLFEISLTCDANRFCIFFLRFLKPAEAEEDRIRSSSVCWC